MKSFLIHFQKTNFVCLFIFILFIGRLAQAETILLKYENLPRLLQEKNGAVSAADLSIQANKERTGFLNRSFLPHVNVDGGVEHFKTGNHSAKTQPYGGAEVTMNLFRGGKDKLEDQSRQSQVTLSESKKEKIIREELSNARNLYWDLVYQREKIKILNQMSQLNIQSQKLAQARVQRGLATNTDVLSIKLFGKQIKEEIESAKHEEKLLQLALAVRLGWKDDSILKTATQIPHEKIEALSNDFIKEVTHPEVEILKGQAQLHKIQSKQFSRWWAPSLDVYGKSYLYTSQEREFPSLKERLDTGVGIKVSSNLFDGLNSRRDAQSEVQQSIANETLAKHKNNILRNDAQLAQEEMIHLSQLIQNGKSYIQQYNVILQQTLQEYDLGLRNTSEASSTLNQYLTLKKSELQYRLEYQKTKTKLLSILGE